MHCREAQHKIFCYRKILKPTTRPWISVLTFWTVVAGWLDASLSSVDKKFLHLRTLSSMSLLAVELGWRLAELPAVVDAADITQFTCSGVN